jgi:MarR family multiple antibiotic resistance transcriptional regulator
MDIKDLPTLSNFLGSWLRLASNYASQDLSRRLASKRVTVAEWEVLWTLYGYPMSPSAVARDLSVDKGGITRLANRLVKKGLLVRRPNEEDGRGHKLTLTRKGSALALELLALVEEGEAELKTRITTGRHAALIRLLTRFMAAPKQ